MANIKTEASFKSRILDFADRASLFILLSLSFCLPLFPAIIPLLIVLFVLLRLPFWRFASITLRQHRSVLFLPLLYLIYVLSMLWTNNPSRGLFDLEVKLSMLVLPLSLVTLDPERIKLQSGRILTLFAEGAFAAFFICLFQALYNLYLTGESESMIYSRFSVILHPSYFSLYLIFAFASVITGSHHSIMLRYIFLLVFATGIILCGSRTGWIVFALTLPLMIFLSSFSRKSRLFISLTLILLLVGVVFFTDIMNRLALLWENPNNFNWARLDIWKASMTAGIDNLPFGTGVGAEKEAIYKHLSTGANEVILERKLNSHNQFLQTLVSTGLGVVLLMAPLWVLLRKGVLKKLWVPVLFSIFVILNFLTESMLETQAGVVFFSFFLTLLLLTTKKNQNHIGKNG